MEDLHRVTEIARRHLGGVHLDDVDADLGALGLASLEKVSFLLDLEKEFDVRIGAEMFAWSNFRTVRIAAATMRSVRNRGSR